MGAVCWPVLFQPGHSSWQPQYSKDIQLGRTVGIVGYFFIGVLLNCLTISYFLVDIHTGCGNSLFNLESFNIVTISVTNSYLNIQIPG